MPAEGYTLTVLQLFCQLEIRITALISYKLLSTYAIVLVVFLLNQKYTSTGYAK